jgi:hypothetical protein
VVPEDTQIEIRTDTEAAIDEEADSSGENEVASYNERGMKTGTLREVNGVLIFDRTKSLSINKRMKRYSAVDGEPTPVVAGYINESDLVDAVVADKPFDFNEAVRKNLVILPDSVANLTQNVRQVLDLATGERVDFELACRTGLIDLKKRRYVDMRGGRRRSMSLFEALGKNYIVMRDELATNYDEDDEDEDDDNQDGEVGKKKKSKLTVEDIASVFDPSSGEQCSLDVAVQLGLFDLARLVYIDLTSREDGENKYRTVELDEAADKGLVLLKATTAAGANKNNYKFLRIKVCLFFFFIN